MHHQLTLLVKNCKLNEHKTLFRHIYQTSNVQTLLKPKKIKASNVFTYRIPAALSIDADVHDWIIIHSPWSRRGKSRRLD